MTPARLLLALFAVVLAARVAAADDAATRSAKRHFDRAQKLYAVAKFRDALDEYQKAFEAKPLPDFLFNIGQCHRNLGDYDAAIFSYKKYLTSAPGAANRAQVEQLIDDLQTKRDQEDARRRGLEPSHGAAPAPGSASRAADLRPLVVLDRARRRGRHRRHRDLRGHPIVIGTAGHGAG
jgi:tetratricopeptide (TPR) repeat protein